MLVLHGRPGFGCQYEIACQGKVIRVAVVPSPRGGVNVVFDAPNEVRITRLMVENKEKQK